MFVEFFFYLRARSLNVSITEWLTLMDALAAGFAGESLLRFYYLCRAICVKHERDFDQYDQVFSNWFQGIETSPELPESSSTARFRAVKVCSGSSSAFGRV